MNGEHAECNADRKEKKKHNEKRTAALEVTKKTSAKKTQIYEIMKMKWRKKKKLFTLLSDGCVRLIQPCRNQIEPELKKRMNNSFQKICSNKYIFSEKYHVVELWLLPGSSLLMVLLPLVCLTACTAIVGIAYSFRTRLH